ncbi:Uma2 family endonuclease [Candidatus Poribacteria bacterium]|nr:Uma2 family endonuclease [Candidatus Poribacteria bacterium]
MTTEETPVATSTPLDFPPVGVAQPARLKMTYEEFREWANEDIHAEWIDGEVIIHMPPKDPHQTLVEFLERTIAFFVEIFHLGVVRIAPFEMRLQESGPAWEPDIMVLKRENLFRLTEDRLEGPADLVIEIISSSSVRHDRDAKFRAYQAGGVREYWVIDSRPNRQRADFYQLDEEGTYRLFATEDDEKVFSTVLPGFWLKPAWLWAEERPGPMTALYEMAGIPNDLISQMQESLQKGLQPRGGEWVSE